MAIIKCKMCGGDLRIEEGSTVCECEYCGTRQTVPSADNEKKLTLFSRAGRLLRGCEFDKAAGVFETIVADFPEEAEAYWGLVLCKYGIEYVDDPATGKKIPTCHRSSFDSVLDDPNFEQACENTDAIARRVYRDEARQIEELRKQIIEVSGKEEPYDIFICYKETGENGDRTLDSVIAQDIYTELTEKGYRVFFSRISLEDKLGTEYEPYIFAALNSAKVMLVVGTDYENFDAVWVKNEWSRFLKLIASGQKKTLIPVFKNMDAYDMPKEFAKLAAQDMGKVGAMQDLVRGVEKLIGIKKTETASQQPVYVSNEADAKTAAAVKRGFMALEDGEWSKAKEYFDQALTLDAECAEAYLGLALADEQCANEDTYISRRCAIRPEQETKSLSPNREREDAAVKTYALPHFLGENAIRELFKFDLTYPSSVKGMQKIAEQEKNSFRKNRNLARAIRFGKGETKAKLDAFQSGFFTKLDDGIEQAKKQEVAAREQKANKYETHLVAAEEKAAELRRVAEDKREAEYQTACKKQSEATTIREYQSVMDSFLEFQSYRDSNQRIDQCRAVIEDLNEKARLQAKAAADETEKKRKAAAEDEERRRIEMERTERLRAARKKRITFAVVIGVVLTVAACCIYMKVIVPSNNYKAAEAMYTAGKYEEAIVAFESLGGYKDSVTRIEEAHESIRARDYAAAQELFEAGQYEEAIKVYQALGKYKDSAARIEEAQDAIHAQDYAAAEALLADGDKAKAAIAFCKLDGYKDARIRGLALWNEIAQRDTIAAGLWHTVGLKVSGSVIAAGSNHDSQCNVSDWTDIVAIAAGSSHTVGLKADGSVVATGKNDYGECNVSGWKNIVAIAAGNLHTVGLKVDGSVVAVGWNKHGECDVSDWTDIIAVAAGEYNTVGLKADGTDIVAVALGEWHTVGLTVDNKVISVGSNGNGQCDVSGWHDIAAVATGGTHTVGLKVDGRVVAAGWNGDGQCNVSGWHDIVAIATGYAHTVGLKADGSVIAVGSNGDGRCEVSGWKNIKLPNR